MATITTAGGTSTTSQSGEAGGVMAQFRRPLDLTGRTVLLATDGSEASVAGGRIALELADRHHATVHVVSVVDTRSAPIPPPLDIALQLGDTMADPAIHRERNAEVSAGLAAAIGKRVDWPVRTMLGTPATAIVQEARRLHASLIIVGLRRHHAVDRALRDETALEVMRHATCPVLGVTPAMARLPRRILVAMDFGETSRIAARTACGLAAEGATLILAYVAPMRAFEGDDGEREIHELGVAAGFERTIGDLEAADLHFDKVVLHHATPRPASATLLEEAETARAELIATGSARHGRLDRWIMGSVSTELVRDGRWPVLVVPPRDKQ